MHVESDQDFSRGDMKAFLIVKKPAAIVLDETMQLGKELPQRTTARQKGF
ncbi:MAG TPA: hypothetical protein VK446_11985 [Methylocystis sp.]|nr:hypothetical protein [Methylocystis sp.]